MWCAINTGPLFLYKQNWPIRITRDQIFFPVQNELGQSELRMTHAANGQITVTFSAPTTRSFFVFRSIFIYIFQAQRNYVYQNEPRPYVTDTAINDVGSCIFATCRPTLTLEAINQSYKWNGSISISEGRQSRPNTLNTNARSTQMLSDTSDIDVRITELE